MMKKPLLQLQEGCYWAWDVGMGLKYEGVARWHQKAVLEQGRRASRYA